MLTSELRGQALNWAIAAALGEHPIIIDVDIDGEPLIRYNGRHRDWAERCSTVAILRDIVTSKFGDEIDVPLKLQGENHA